MADAVRVGGLREGQGPREAQSHRAALKSHGFQLQYLPQDSVSPSPKQGSHFNLKGLL